jgi:hypothetical protein
VNTLGILQAHPARKEKWTYIIHALYGGVEVTLLFPERGDGWGQPISGGGGAALAWAGVRELGRKQPNRGGGGFPPFFLSISISYFYSYFFYLLFF